VLLAQAVCGGVNGNGMHTTFRSAKTQESFLDPKGDKSSQDGLGVSWTAILTHATKLFVAHASVNRIGGFDFLT